MTNDPSPCISVVIPTFNRRDRLARVLESLARQDLAEPFEVIVVSDGSTDTTDDYLRSADVPLPVVALTQRNQGPSAARNLGVANASSELVLFVDDDVVPAPGLVRTHLAAHRSLGERMAVIGPMINPSDHEMSPWVAWEQQMLAKQYRDMSNGVYAATARQLYTGNASMRAADFNEAGGFDTRFRRAEDVELAYRLDDIAVRFHFAPEAIGLHYAERSYGAWRDAAFTYGANDVVFARDLHRQWIFGFLRYSFKRQHPATRLLVARCIHSARWREGTKRVLEPLVRGKGIGGRRIMRVITRYALSAIYAVEYYCGVADELGSPDAFERLVRFGAATDS